MKSNTKVVQTRDNMLRSHISLLTGVTNQVTNELSFNHVMISKVEM